MRTGPQFLKYRSEILHRCFTNQLTRCSFVRTTDIGPLWRIAAIRTNRSKTSFLYENLFLFQKGRYQNVARFINQGIAAFCENSFQIKLLYIYTNNTLA